MQLHYQTIVETLNDHFPELMQHEECRKIIGWANECENLPYLYFPAFWKLLKLVLTKQIKDKNLQDRIFLFMEEMAKSDDQDVVNLMQIEMPEPIFGLEHDVYREVVFRLLLPETLKLHHENLRLFNAPQKQIKNESQQNETQQKVEIII